MVELNHLIFLQIKYTKIKQKVDLTLLDLNEIYIKKDSLNEQDIKNHIENNKDSFLLKWSIYLMLKSHLKF